MYSSSVTKPVYEFVPPPSSQQIMNDERWFPSASDSQSLYVDHGELTQQQKADAAMFSHRTWVPQDRVFQQMNELRRDAPPRPQLPGLTDIQQLLAQYGFRPEAIAMIIGLIAYYGLVPHSVQNFLLQQGALLAHTAAALSATATLRAFMKAYQKYEQLIGSSLTLSRRAGLLTAKESRAFKSDRKKIAKEQPKKKAQLKAVCNLSMQDKWNYDWTGTAIGSSYGRPQHFLAVLKANPRKTKLIPTGNMLWEPVPESLEETFKREKAVKKIFQKLVGYETEIEEGFHDYCKKLNEVIIEYKLPKNVVKIVSMNSAIGKKLFISSAIEQQLLQTLLHVHRSGAMMLDLQPENIWLGLNANEQVVYANFGFLNGSCHFGEGDCDQLVATGWFSAVQVDQQDEFGMNYSGVQAIIPGDAWKKHVDKLQSAHECNLLTNTELTTVSIQKQERIILQNMIKCHNQKIVQ